MPLEPGDRLGPYKIQALLGVGGMGEVYRGLDSRLGRDVALKVISQQLVGNPSSRRRFETEARAASALNHPAIVTIYDVGESDGVSWIAMEWVEGRTLRDVLADGPLPVREAWSIARQIADGLAVAHAKGIVHRDLKPENVMLSADGRAKILDFGLARQNVVDLPDGASALETMAGPSGAATFAGAILGTVGYMSPEQASGRTADFRSDQFSLGLVIYELLTGRRAFVRPTAVETLSAIIREDPPPIASMRGGTSAAFRSVISRCLAKLPEERFPSTRELATTLESLTPDSAESAVASTSPATATVESPAALRAARLLRARAFILVAASLSLTFAIVSWNRWRVSQPAITSLAVLPFEDTSKDPDTEYLGDGLTESLIGHLSRVPSLKVMARGTVIRFKGLADPQQAGRTLGVGAVVTGTVARRSDRVVISAELIDSSTGERLWGQTYDRPFTDLLRVQDSIVAEISDGLRLRLSGQEKQRLGGFGTENVEAYERYLKGQYLMSNDTEEDDLEAEQLFLQALDKDPNFLDAHVAVSSVYARKAGNGYAPPREALTRAAEGIRKAIAIDPANVVVRAADVSNRFQLSLDWATAEREYRALSQEPGLLLSVQYHPIAVFFVAIGRPAEAVALMERALAVDPGNTESRIMLGNFLIQSGRLDQALSVYKTIADDNPQDPRPHFGTADVYKRRGDFARAIDARRKAYELAGDDDGTRALSGATTEADFEKAEVAVARIRLQELRELAKERYISPLDIARLHALVGEREQALAGLEQALADPPNGLTLLKADQAWDPIRSDPRFAAIVKRVGIP